jgi:hypothetical protein
VFDAGKKTSCAKSHFHCSDQDDVLFKKNYSFDKAGPLFLDV